MPMCPPAKPQINDDDIYVAEFQGRHGWKIIHNLGSSSASAAFARNGGVNVQVGQALFKGMTLKGLM